MLNLNILKLTLKCSVIFSILIILIISISSCSSRKNSPVNCVAAFIIASEQHDMTNAWELLSPEAQKYYNEIGEKNRKSGKGILEHDISEIKSFRRLRTDYNIETDSANSSLVKIKTRAGLVYEILTTDIDGDYRLKDGNAVRNLINGIAVDIIKKEYY